MFSVVSVVEDLAHDWPQETSPTYFRCSLFSDFHCKITSCFPPFCSLKMLTVFLNIIVQPKHKIQSSAPLQLYLVQCPKMMAPLVKEWIPQAFTVSFKVQKHV